MVRNARYGAKKSPEGREIALGFCHPTTVRLSVNPAVNWNHFRIREGSERRGMDSACHLLCPRYNGL